MGGGEKDGAGPVEPGADGDTMPPAYDEAKGLTEEEEGKVKITTSETKIEMGKEKKVAAEEGFKGLTKEELMQYATDPFWVKLRWALFILFWIIWVAMLVSSVIIIIYAPKCPSPDPKQWWQKGPIYKVDVGSFPDTNEDGKGDLKGVEEKVNYLVEAGVGTAYFTNLISDGNLREVRQEFGNMEDWRQLATALQERGLKVIVDFVPGKTSVHHMWYEEAQANNKAYASFYKTGTELDLENSKVQAALQEELKFWLDNSVDGFVVQDAAGVPEDLLQGFRKVLEEATETAGTEKVLVTEDLVASLVHSGVGAGAPVHMLLSEDLLPGEEPLTAGIIKASLDDFMAAVPCSADAEENCAWPAFQLSTTAHGADFVDALTMFKMLLPGTVVTNAGEELGLAAMDWGKVEGEGAKRLQLYSLLAAKLRHADAILYGDLINENSVVLSDTVFGLIRVKKGSPGFLLLANLGPDNKMVDVSEVPRVPESVRVLESGGALAVSPEVEGEPKRFEAKEVPLGAWQAKIFNFVPKFD
jgi:hypothetical protein